MKKITLILLMLSSTIGFAQGPWNFPTDVQSWVVQGSSTVSWDGTVFNTASGSLKTVTTAVTAGAKSPTFTPTISGDYIFSAYIKGTAGDKVRLDIFQGSSSIGTDYTLLTSNFELVTRTVTIVAGTNMTLRILDRTGSKTIYIDDVTFTYQIPAGSILTTNVIGAGTVAKSPDAISYPIANTDVALTPTPKSHWSFSNWSGDLTGSTNPGHIILDGTTNKTVTANFTIDPSFNYDFLFNTAGDFEGWSTDPLLAASLPAGGIVTLTPTADQFARFSLTGFPINPTTYNKVTIRLKNNSATTDQLSVVVANDVPATSTTIVKTLSTSDSAFMTYEIPLNSILTWSGTIVDFRIRFADADNVNAGKPSDAGTIEIEDIIFTFDPSLGLDAISKNNNSISLYPNPAKDVLNISSASKVISVDVYDSTGRLVLKSDNKSNDQINVSDLQSGIYIVRLKDADNNFEDKKVIISK
jgi:hypothetical protein